MNTREVQAALIALGYPLPKSGADGSFGDESRTAMNDFQRDNDLPVSVLPDRRTIESLKAALVPKRSSVFTLPPTKRRINEIIIHCTATPESRDVSVETIRGWHKAQGWKGIGYHWVVMLDGTVKPGRPEADIGSHVAGHNIGTLGVVYVGGVAADGKTAKDTRTPAQRAALLAHVKALIARYPTVKKVTGHNQYANKACPSFDVRKDELGRLI